MSTRNVKVGGGGLGIVVPQSSDAVLVNTILVVALVAKSLKRREVIVVMAPVRRS